MKKWGVLLLFLVVLLVSIPVVFTSSTCFYYYNLDAGGQMDIRTSQHVLPSCNGCWAAHGVLGQLMEVDCTAIQQGRVVYVNGGDTDGGGGEAYLPTTDAQDVYGWMAECLAREYAITYDADQTIDNCKFDYDNEVSRYDLWVVASCYEDCVAKGFGNCNAYCNAVRQKLAVMENKAPVDQAIDDWARRMGLVVVPDPTCFDNIWNQGETRTDCGGPCPPCKPTCSDRIKNQGEEGVDCGSPCRACMTCSDEIKNQGEKDVDCGGPCKTCITCDDGIQNQDEKGIDCGGPCEPCPTCDDGIQNQDEEGIDCGGSCRGTCPTCDDKILNQGEEGVDCGGPCKDCIRVITFNDLSKKDQDKLAKLYFYLVYHEKKGNRQQALIFESQILEFWKIVSEKMGADPSAFDIMNHFVKLRADQTSMSDYEKKDRRKTAQLAYASLLVDEYRLKKGRGNAQDIYDKKEEIKAQYGRILFFDPDDVQANKAIGDIYRKEGDEDAAKFFHRAAMKSAAKNDPASYNELKKIVATYKKEASDDLNLPAPPTDMTSKVISHLSEKAKKYVDKADLSIYQQQQDIEIWLESATLVEERKKLWEMFDAFLYQFNPKQLEELAGVESE